MAQFIDIKETGQFYACVMRLWQHYKKAQGFLAIESRYEDIVDDLESSARRLLSHCNLEWDDKVLKYHNQAAQRIVRTPSNQAIAKPIYRSSIGKWKNYESELYPLMKYLDPFIDALCYQAH